MNAIGTPWCHLDLVAVAGAAREHVTVVLPKVEHPHDLAFADRLLAGAEAAAGRETPVRLLALIETAAGLQAVGGAGARERAPGRADPRLRRPRRLARAARAARRATGASRSTRCSWPRARPGSRRSTARTWRSATTSRFRAEVAHARALGYDGKWAIHPAQLDALREAFTPTEAEVADARETLAALDRAAAEGAGAVAAGDRMLDEALAVSARRVLARAGEAGVSAPPYFEDLQVGTVFEDAPPLTLTEGHAALHQAIAGDRLRLALDRTLGEAVLGAGPPLAHPALVWDVAIGQSTVATGRVIANLFYRGLLLRRPVRLGDTLRTTTEVVARRENRSRPTGLAVLRIRTVDQEDRPVLDFTRCAMLPLRDEPTGEAGDEVGGAEDLAHERAARRPRTGSTSPPSASARPARTSTRCRTAGPTSSRAATWSTPRPALARLTLNVAMAHLDAGAAAHKRRLVYGGHTIALAAAQAARALPGLVTILGWHAADHTAPVFEGDTLRSRLELELREALPDGGGLVHLRSPS